MNLAKVQELISSNLAQVSTSIPAVVLKFDSKNQTVDVEIAVKRPYYGDTAEDNPIRLLKVPVKYPQGSDWVIYGPLKKGDAVTLLFPMFDCDDWFNGDKNKTYEAGSKYYHDIDGAFALPGAFTYKSPTRDSRFKDIFHIVQGENYITMEKGKLVVSHNNEESVLTMQGSVSTLDTQTFNINANVNVDGDLAVTGTISAPTILAGVSLKVGSLEVSTHTHTEQGDGNETSGPNGGI